MCGIAGKLYFDPNRQVRRDLILNMNRALARRGPDDEGVWIKGNIGLGHRRLAIIDPSPSGRQPMSDSEGKIWIVFNGEIYNFLELRRELEKDGVRFRSKTDTEAIIYLYKKHGVDCLKYLRGMFAFAIWDDDKKHLFLARDRVGKKPLKFFHGPDFFVFASELKAILKDPQVRGEPDFEAIHHYLTFQYAPAPLTGFRGIRKLPAGHYLLLKLTEERGYQTEKRGIENTELLYENLTYKIRGALFEVWKQLGPVFKESIYQKSLEKEFLKRGISYESQKEIPIHYNKEKIGTYRPDFIIDNKIILELKKINFLTKNEVSQIKYYLKGSDYKLALLANFGGKKLQIERYIYDENSRVNPSDIRVIPSIEIKRYWRLDYSEKWDLSEKEWGEKIMAKLEESVKLRMISDVPLGAFLSGGVDSSAIVGLMAKVSSRPVKTFTVGFEEQSHDETPYARRVAELFKTEHTELVAKPDAVEILPELARQYEEPYADSSALPSWYLAKLTKKYVTVALNGDGGDENFGGYVRYNACKIFYEFHRLPKTLRKKLLPKIVGILAKLFYYGPRKEKLLRFAKEIGQDPEKSYLELVSYFNSEQKSRLWTEEFPARGGSASGGKNRLAETDSFKILEPKFQEAEKFDWLDKVFYADFNTYLPDDLLVKMDIATMSHGLESRSPLLDHEFLELTAKIPAYLKINGFSRISDGFSLKKISAPFRLISALFRQNENKYIFKKALAGFLPAEILRRPKKGFGAPLERWFKNELKNYLKSVLLSRKARVRGLFKKEEIERLIEEHGRGKTNYAHHLWALLALEHWFRQYFD